MKNLIKKSLLLGMGAISLTREKAEKIVRELEEKGEMTSSETKDFVNELVEKGEQERQLFKDAVKRELTALQENMGIPAKTDLAALEERIKRLEERMGISSVNGGQEAQTAETAQTAQTAQTTEFPSGE